MTVSTYIYMYLRVNIYQTTLPNSFTNIMCLPNICSKHEYWYKN